MKRVSIEESFLWAQRFAIREWRLLLPVALAFLALPPLALELLTPPALLAQIMPSADGPSPTALASAIWLLPAGLVVMLLNLWGGLAIVALATLPGISVREAILRALGRLPTLIGVALLVGLGLAILTIVLSMLLLVAGVGPVQQRGLLVGLLLGIGLFLWVRLAPLAPLLIERRIGPIAAMRLAWELTQGVLWRLLAGLGTYVIGGFVVLIALRSALGVVLMLLARVAGTPEIGTALDAVLFRAGGAVFSTGLQLLLVAFYRQLTGSSKGT